MEGFAPLPLIRIKAGWKIRVLMTKLTEPSDIELLRLSADGDEPAFLTLYQRHYGLVYRFALLMSGSINIAEEVAQEVFLSLIRDASGYDSERAPLPSYLCGMARNQVRRLLSRERPYFQLVDDDTDVERLPQLITQDDPFRDFTRNEMIRFVRQAVLALPAHYREVVVLCDFEELSYADAALILDCPIGTVNSRLHRGHALLLKSCAFSKVTSRQPLLLE